MSQEEKLLIEKLVDELAQSQKKKADAKGASKKQVKRNNEKSEEE